MLYGRTHHRLCRAPSVSLSLTLWLSRLSLVSLRVARASHILLKGYDEETVAQLEEWKAEVDNDPTKFASLASIHSLCPSRTKGGDLGFFTRGKMVREFDAIVFNEEPGNVYGPVRSDFGHHLIFLHSCRLP